LTALAEEIQESSEAIVEAVAFLSGQRDFRNSRVLQPTIATKNVGARITLLLYLSSALFVNYAWLVKSQKERRQSVDVLDRQ
jgi:hypothetical protein